MARKYWTCRTCGFRNDRTSQKCHGVVREVVDQGERFRPCSTRRPKARVPAHARTLRDDSYATYRATNERLHGSAFDLAEWDADCCGVCGKRPTTARHMDRDHDHATGLPRGLACPGNTGCNALMPRQMTLERARAVVGYLERVAVSGAPAASEEVA